MNIGEPITGKDRLRRAGGKWDCVMGSPWIDSDVNWHCGLHQALISRSGNRRSGVRGYRLSGIAYQLAASILDCIFANVVYDVTRKNSVFSTTVSLHEDT
jgi:hypothetical protein